MSAAHSSDVLGVIAQEQQRQELQAQFAKDDQRDAEASADVLRERAAQETHRLAEQAEQIEGQLTGLAHEARDVLDDAKAGRITKDQAVQRLRAARKTYSDLADQQAQLTADLAAARGVLDDPAAERDRLLSKYPVLRR
ncbi:hypothetical protein [Calidifontibacter terrae]